MKKLIVCLCVIFALALTGCSSSTDDLSTEIEQLKTQVTALTEENNKLKDDIIELEGIINNSNDTAEEENNNSDSDDNSLDKYPMYKQWLAAEGYSKQERDMYLNVVAGTINMRNEIYSGRWLDAGTKKLLTFITGKTISDSATPAEVRSVYESLFSDISNTSYCIMDFIYEYEDSATGIYCFLYAINNLENSKFNGKDLVKYDSSLASYKAINGFSFNMKEVATVLGISVELVEILVHASIDAGFNVTFDGYNVKA